MALPAIPTTSTPMIARRTLMFATKRKLKRVQIRIGQPVRDVSTAGGLDWRCPISITGFTKGPRQGLGVDSLQALIHALKLVEIELDAAQGTATVVLNGWASHGTVCLRSAFRRCRGHGLTRYCSRRAALGKHAGAGNSHARLAAERHCVDMAVRCQVSTRLLSHCYS